MADQKNEPKPQPKKEPAAALGSAAASTNPVVHQLLAERAIAVSNGDDDAIDAIDGQLASLGVE